MGDRKLQGFYKAATHSQVCPVEESVLNIRCLANGKVWSTDKIRTGTGFYQGALKLPCLHRETAPPFAVQTMEFQKRAHCKICRGPGNHKISTAVTHKVSLRVLRPPPNDSNIQRFQISSKVKQFAGGIIFEERKERKKNQGSLLPNSRDITLRACYQPFAGTHYNRWDCASESASCVIMKLSTGRGG